MVDTITEPNATQYFGMSDDEFMKLNSAPPAADVVAADPSTTPAVAAAAEPQAEAAVDTTDPEQTEHKPDVDIDADTDVDADASQPGSDEPNAAEPASPGTAAKPEATAAEAAKDAAATQAKPADASGAATVAEDGKAVDYEGFFKQVMTPFKANGRSFELKSPEEAIRLMQMGAGYGRKIQDLQPALKTVRMLEKNGLLDEGKLSFLIDINNKNPEAIKKLITDSGIDPLDLNIGDNVSYSPKSHAVSDTEMAFHSALEEAQSLPGGQETLRHINQSWDQESKSALWDSPQIINLIHSQRESGVYDQIVAEVERKKTLGEISHNTPFLKAYTLAGDHLKATNGFKLPDPATALPGVTTVTAQQPQVIATRAEAPKAQLGNGDKAAAAASTKTTTTRKAGATVNPLNLPDDEFLKQFAGRL